MKHWRSILALVIVASAIVAGISLLDLYTWSPPTPDPRPVPPTDVTAPCTRAADDAMSQISLMVNRWGYYSPQADQNLINTAPECKGLSVADKIDVVNAISSKWHGQYSIALTRVVGM